MKRKQNIVKCALSVLFLVVFTALALQAQNPGTLNASFLRDKFEVDPSRTFFNVLEISNNGKTPLEIVINFTLPLGWEMIGEKNLRIIVPAEGKQELPIRISVNKSAKGNIAYLIAADILDKKGNILDKPSFSVNLPAISNLKIRNNSNLLYFNQRTGSVDAVFTVKNSGNIAEMLYFFIEKDESLFIQGEIDNNFQYDILVPPFTDTTIVFKVFLSSNEIYEKKYSHNLNIRVGTFSKTEEYHIWCKKLGYRYENPIPENLKCAVAELYAQNLFTESDPSFRGMLMANILFKYDRALYLQYNGYTYGDSFDPWKNSVVRLGYKTPMMHLVAGDVYDVMEQSLFGRGAKGTFTLGNNVLSIIGTKNIFTPITNYGGSYRRYIGKQYIEAGSAYSLNEETSQKETLGYLKVGLQLGQRHSLTLLGGQSYEDFERYNITNNGYGLSGTYRYNSKRVKFNLSMEQGSPRYTGMSRGKSLFHGSGSILLTEKNSILMYYSKIKTSQTTYDFSDTSLTERDIQYEHLQLYDGFPIGNRAFFKIGPELSRAHTDALLGTSDTLFETRSAYINTALRTRSRNLQGMYNISLHYGVSQVRFYDDGRLLTDPDTIPFNPYTTFDKPPYFNYRISISMHQHNWGLYSIYYSGPYNLNQAYLHYRTNYYPRYFILMPYFEKYLYKDIIKFGFRGSFNHNLVNRTSRTNIIADLRYYIPEMDLSFHMMNTTSLYSDRSADKGNLETYVSNYLEFGVRKEFNCAQPAIKFHDVKINFFKDLNGNKHRDTNEPGVSSVIVYLTSQTHPEGNLDMEYNPPELLSNHLGYIHYENVPEGMYVFDFKSIENTGNFLPDSFQVAAAVHSDQTIWVPFREKNKIFGKIVINRSPFSNLELISPANIRVTAANDSTGDVISVLSNNAGYFELYVPKTDRYVVSVNNIYANLFDLQRSQYEVVFNGYKAFEIFFIFNERNRPIEFTNTFIEENINSGDVRQVRKVTLKGKVMNIKTLEPLDAQIRIIDGASGQVIDNTVSGKGTGAYFTSFLSGKNYLIEVSKTGYITTIENLYLDQVSTIETIERDILLEEGTGTKQKLRPSFELEDDDYQDDINYEYIPGDNPGTKPNPGDNKTKTMPDSDITDPNPNPGKYSLDDEPSNEVKRKLSVDQEQFKLKDVTFEFNRSEIETHCYKELDRVIELMKLNPSVMIELGGHADDIGSEAANKKISKARATVVANYFISNGISARRIAIKGYGNGFPLLSNDSDDSRRKNRRVELTITAY